MRQLAASVQLSTRGEHSNLSNSAVTGAGVGAGIFSVIALVTGINVGQMAALGATIGGARGASDSVKSSRVIVARCMQGRGYSVLN